MENEDKKYPQRTIPQNRALHLMFRQLADDLNDHGLYIQKVLKPSIDIPWTEALVKELLWRTVQQAYLQKESTTQLKTNEIDQVFDVICKHLGERFGIQLEFPSIETVMLMQDEQGK